ncbi:MAG: efflux RND transporter periplasmic adaptor subunit [Candidatus Aminicenantales bacterium]|jgi:HlyD family secretion protein
MRKRNTVIIPVSLLVLIGFFSAACKSGASQYVTEKITRGDIITAVTATGTVNAVTSVNVGTQASGRITKLFVDFNSQVKKGALIALIDPALFQAAVDQANANLANAKANVAKAIATEVDAKRTWDRNKNLFGRDLVAKSQMDAAETAYLTAAASTVAAKTQVDQTAGALSLAETNLLYTKIISPVDGTVISRNVDVGQTVAASFQTPTLFVIAADLTKMQIDTSVDEADVSNVKVGQDVDFTVDAYPDVTFKGKVLQVRKASAILQNVVTYDVVVQVDNKDLKLMPGMTAQVSIITSVVRNVVRIPNGALRFRPMEKGKPVAAGRGPAVWTLENNQPKRIPVKIGFSDGTYTELVSGDVKEGEIIIVESLSKPNSQAAGFRMF